MACSTNLTERAMPGVDIHTVTLFTVPDLPPQNVPLSKLFQ